MSAPETTSKGRPSLLSETAAGGPDNSSRILASLEGRVSAQQLPRRRSKKPWGVAAIAAVVGIGALGAWQWQRSQDAGHAAVAGAARAAAGASAVANASGAAASGAHVAQGGQGAASAPQAAVIVAENTASSPAVTGTDPLSRALANGASSAGQAAAATGSSGAAAAANPSATNKPAAAHAQSGNTKTHRTAKLAAERWGKHARGRAAGKHDDPDADLLAALVARTKPYDAHAPQSASDAKAAAAAKGRPVSVAAQIKQCDKSNFFEAQLCRWRVCSDHWGKDPACPSVKHAPQTR
jgi:hypothetical protein